MINDTKRIRHKFYQLMESSPILAGDAWILGMDPQVYHSDYTVACFVFSLQKLGNLLFRADQMCTAQELKICHLLEIHEN